MRQAPAARKYRLGDTLYRRCSILTTLRKGTSAPPRRSASARALVLATIGNPTLVR